MKIYSYRGKKNLSGDKIREARLKQRLSLKSQALNAKNITGFCVLSFSQFPFCFFVHIQQPSNFAISSLKRSSAVP